MHILFLTDNFPPEVNAPASRTFEHSREWVASGHRVTVVTCAPNFPNGKIFAGYKNRLWHEERMEGVRVIRVWTYVTANSGFLRRTLDYLSFMMMGTVGGLCVRNVDVVVGTSPQFFTACAAWCVSAVKRRPFVFELRDLWPESIKAVGAMKDSFVIRLLERIENFLYVKATRIVSVTHSFRAALMSRGIDGRSIDVVTNGVDLSRFAPRAKDRELAERLGLGDKFVVGYVGTHGMAHGLDTVLGAARLVEELSDGDQYRIVLLGDGAAKADLVVKAKELALSNVVFIDTVPKSEVARYWSLLDVSVIHLKRDPLFRTVIPSKLFESIGMGIPVLHGVQGESEEIVNRERVGVVFQSEDAAGLVKGLMRLKTDSRFYDECRHNCLRAAHKYDRKAMAALMLKSIEAVGVRPTST
jgi:glycosyltransferase involved in cell wall biosynthesis